MSEIPPYGTEEHELWRAQRRREVRQWNTEKRKSALSWATPPWANKPAIAAIYAEARKLTKETGVKHEVDHIIPIHGKKVCGLHVEWNLQVITKANNNSKHAHFISE